MESAVFSSCGCIAKCEFTDPVFTEEEAEAHNLVTFLSQDSSLGLSVLWALLLPLWPGHLSLAVQSDRRIPPAHGAVLPRVQMGGICTTYSCCSSFHLLGFG